MPRNRRYFEVNLPRNLHGHSDYSRRVPITSGVGVYDSRYDALSNFLNRRDRGTGKQNFGTVFYRVFVDSIDRYVKELTREEFEKKKASPVSYAVEAPETVSLQGMCFALSHDFARSLYEKFGSQSEYEPLRIEEEAKLMKKNPDQIRAMFFRSYNPDGTKKKSVA